MTLTTRFWAKVNRAGPRQPHMRSRCWPWTGAKHGQGYGRMIVNGRDTLAHHVAYAVQVGPVPAGKGVLHHCDYPPCQRGSHLFAGTVLENNADRHAKGRSRGGRSRAKLTEADVKEIRRMRADGVPQKAVAARFNIHPNNVGLIARHETWKHVGGAR